MYLAKEISVQIILLYWRNHILHLLCSSVLEESHTTSSLLFCTAGITYYIFFALLYCRNHILHLLCSSVLQEPHTTSSLLFCTGGITYYIYHELKIYFSSWVSLHVTDFTAEKDRKALVENCVHVCDYKKYLRHRPMVYGHVSSCLERQRKAW